MTFEKSDEQMPTDQSRRQTTPKLSHRSSVDREDGEELIDINLSKRMKRVTGHLSSKRGNSSKGMAIKKKHFKPVKKEVQL
jgi:hypothetical protein